MTPVAEVAAFQSALSSNEDAGSLPLRLRCPRCKQNLSGALACDACGLLLREQDGIVRALNPDRLSHFASFIVDYAHVRASEGRGSKNNEYYLCLPHVDKTGRNAKQWNMRARSYKYLKAHILPKISKEGVVLDLGAGNCWLSYRLAEEGFRPVAVDLITNVEDGLGAGIHYEPVLGAPIPRFQAEMGNLPFQDEQLDCVIFNASFHYAEDAEAILREAKRCLKPKGVIVICDSPWYSNEEHGHQMVAERRARFLEKFQTASDSIKSVEFLTDERLSTLANALSIQWAIHRPWYGWAWAARPWLAKLRRRREPSSFRIHVARCL